ncbi:MAG: hypothetical protein K8F31_05525, partial [Roseovarius sp.]|nr:hypothetical protein [Roseovarius sp.]
AATAAITATAASGGSTITTGTGAYNDIITLGDSNDTVTTDAGDDTVNATQSTLDAGDNVNAGVGGTDVLAITGGTVTMGVNITNFEQVTLATGTIFTANDTGNLDIDGSGVADDITTGNAVQRVDAGSGNDTITLGAAGQTINGDNGNDTVVLDTDYIAGSTINGGNNTDTLEFAITTGTDTIDLNTLAGVTSFENVSTGTTAIDLTLTAAGYQVNVQGGADHVIDATANTGADDIFRFDNNGWAGHSVTIAQFMQGGGNDILDLGLLGIQTYWDAALYNLADVDAVLTGGGIEAVFAQDTDTLYVDLDADGFYLAGNDLAIVLSGVTDLTEATDILI